MASFRSKADRNIEDVIKKLPGVEVSENGGISYNGERINRFYIEGLDVVGGRYAIATRNISPDDIISVEVFENHQPKQVLKNIDITNKAALNLKMKRKSMLKPVGNVKGGAGADDNGDAKWLGEAFGMLIAPATQVLATAKTNNWGVRMPTKRSRSLQKARRRLRLQANSTALLLSARPKSLRTLFRQPLRLGLGQHHKQNRTIRQAQFHSRLHRRGQPDRQHRINHI